MKTLMFVVVAFLFIVDGFAARTPRVPEVELSGEFGGRLDGSSWSTKELRGKVHALFYVDPDEKDLNNAASEALKNAGLPAKKFASVAVINMDATWLPNFAIEASLAKKQKQYPDTLYVKDMKKVLVGALDLKDDSSNVVIYDRRGREVFRHKGELKQKEIEQMLQAVHRSLGPKRRRAK